MASAAVFGGGAGLFEGRLSELLKDVDELSPRVTALADVSVRYRDSLRGAQVCGAALCSSLRDLFAGELGGRLTAGSASSLERVLGVLTEVADLLGELSQQVDVHLCEGVRGRWVEGLLPEVQTHRLCLKEAREHCQELRATSGTLTDEGELCREYGRDREYADIACERASVSLASEVGKVSVLMRHEFMEAASACFHSHLRFFTQGHKIAAEAMGMLPSMMTAIDMQKVEGRQTLLQLERQLAVQRGINPVDMHSSEGGFIPSQVEEQLQEGWASLLAQCYSLSNDASGDIGARSASGGTIVDSTTIERIVSGADALLAQMPSVLQLTQAPRVERVWVDSHRQVELILDCLGADADRVLCKSDIKKVLAWMYGYRILLQDVGGSVALLGNQLLHTTASGRNEGKAPGELLISAYLAKLRQEHRSYIANVIRADYCAEAVVSGPTGGDMRMDAHKLARGARDLFHILQIEAEDVVGLVGGDILNRLARGLLRTPQRYQLTLLRSIRDSASELTELDLCTFIASAMAGSDMTVELADCMSEALEDPPMREDLEREADSIAREFLTVAKIALFSLVDASLHAPLMEAARNALFTTDSWRRGETAQTVAEHLGNFFERMRGLLDKGIHRRLVAHMGHQLAKLYVAVLLERLPPLVDATFEARLRADLQEFSALVETTLIATPAAALESAETRKTAGEPQELLEPMPSVLQILVEDTTEGLVLGYHTALQFMPSLTPYQLEGVLRTRRGLPRTDRRDVIRQCVTVYENFSGLENSSLLVNDDCGNGEFSRVPLGLKMRRAISAADKARSCLLNRFKALSVSSRDTADSELRTDTRISTNAKKSNSDA